MLRSYPPPRCQLYSSHRQVEAYITGLLLQPSDLVNRSLEVPTLIISLDFIVLASLPWRAPQPEAVEP